MRLCCVLQAWRTTRTSRPAKASGIVNQPPIASTECKPQRRLQARSNSPRRRACGSTPALLSAPIGSLILYANKVVNLTSLELIFSQLGAPLSQVQSLPPHSEVMHSWRLLTAPAKGSIGGAPASSGSAEFPRALRFRLAEDWHWSEPVEFKVREGQSWLALGPPDNYMLLQIKIDERGLQRTLTLAASHTIINQLNVPLWIQLDSNAKVRTSRPELLMGSTQHESPKQLLARSSTLPLLLSFSRSAMRSHSIEVSLAVSLPELSPGAEFVRASGSSPVQIHEKPVTSLQVSKLLATALS